MAAAGLKAGRVAVFEDDAALAAAAAERIVNRLAEARGPAGIVLTGGRSPLTLYHLLASSAWRDRIPWHDTHWFWSDERAVPADDSRNNAAMAMHEFLERTPAPRENIHAIPTDGTVEACAARYEATLKRFHGADRLAGGRPLFAAVILGIGDDGHVASLFPGQATLEERSRWVVGVPEAGLAPLVPRISLTLPALASSREVLVLVSGADKGRVLARVAKDDDLPAARLRNDALTWMVDREAAEAMAAGQG